MNKGFACRVVVVSLTVFIMVGVMSFWASAEITEDTWTREASMDVEKRGSWSGRASILKIER